MKDLTMSQALTQLHKVALKVGSTIPCSIQMDLGWYPIHNDKERTEYNTKNKYGFIHLDECHMSPKFATWREVIHYFEELIKSKGAV